MQSKCTDLYIRIDRKLDPARLPSLLDVFQQLLPGTVLTLTVTGHENGEHRILSIIII